MALDELTTEQKEAFVRYRAENHTIKDSIEWFLEEYPDAHEYANTTMKLWFHSKEGKKLYNQELQRVRGEARTREYANKESRIIALVEIVGKLHMALRDLDPKADNKFPQLFREFREGLSALRVETDEGFGTEVAASAFEGFVTAIQGSPFAWALKKELPQTHETPDN